MTTRDGGISVAPYASFNLGSHVGDDPLAVASNRALLRLALPAEPVWLNQIHSTTVADADNADGVADADASVARTRGTVCALLTADCLPVLLCARDGSVVAAAHAGWRGLHAGVLEATVAAMQVAPTELMAWLGAAIGPAAFAVGDEVRAAFVAADDAAAAAFVPHHGKWLADLYALARLRLHACGVEPIYGGGLCTHSDATRFYSYRRDGVCGRMATLIWLA
jgi:YfiH family protein